jgi:hypothetical protein
VIVEWNPPLDQPPLFEILPECSDLPIRVITVPKKYHDLTGIKLSFAEWPAKNVGLMRCKGEFALISNPDILMTASLVKHLSERQLQYNTVYRCDRYDFDGDGIDEVDPENYVSFAVKKVFMLHGMHNAEALTLDVDLRKTNNTLPVSSYNEETIHTNASGDFMLIDLKTAHSVGGFYEGPDWPRGHADSVSMYRFMLQGVKHGVFNFPSFVLHQDHDRGTALDPYDHSRVLKTAQTSVGQTFGLPNITLEEWRNK